MIYLTALYLIEIIRTIPIYSLHSNKLRKVNININIRCENDITNDEMQNNIRNGIKNGYLNEIIKKTLIDEKYTLILEKNKKYEILTTNSNNEYKNFSSIKLGECENILKKYYNIDENESLLIFKVDIYEEVLLLNLSICEDLKIELLLPCNIDENNIFKYNSSSEYYNDICYPYTTTEGTDIVLSDRKNEFIDYNMSLCEKDCEYNWYDSNTKKSKCDCKTKTQLPIISEVKIDKDSLINNLININEITNLKII